MEEIDFENDCDVMTQNSLKCFLSLYLWSNLIVNGTYNTFVFYVYISKISIFININEEMNHIFKCK